jgi:carbon monoxide dehydrogenase subunit G
MGRTARISQSVQIDRPATEVWAAIADYAFDLQWRNGLREMAPDPPGGPELGTKVHEVLHSSGRDFVADTVVTELEPGVSYRFAGEGTIGAVSGGRRVATTNGQRGAEFTYEIELEPRGFMRLLGPVLGPMARSGLKKDLERLKELLESQN